MRNAPQIIVIIGPTASGKSALAVRIAKEIGGEVVSADSRQVYKGLDIGTGKVTKREMQGVRHHLLDVASPKRVFTAHDFVAHAQRAIGDILRRGKVPIVCGGTGFYIDALLGRITLAAAPPDTTLRTQLADQTPEQLFALLRTHDPERAARMNDSDRKNPVRLIRAIEIAAAPKPYNMEMRYPYHYEAEWIGIKPDMETLRKKIHTRLLARMRRGMVAEARRLHDPPAGGGLSYKRMEALGLEYRYLARYLQGSSKEEMLAQLEAQIWQYAKRQMTYWKRNTDIKWVADPHEIIPSRLSAANASSKRSGKRSRTSMIDAS